MHSKNGKGHTKRVRTVADKRREVVKARSRAYRAMVKARKAQPCPA